MRTYGHANHLPTEVPFLASHDAGGNFGARRSACDGHRTVEVPATSEGFVVEWDTTKNSPTAASLALIRSYFAVWQRAQQLLLLWVDSPSGSRTGQWTWQIPSLPVPLGLRSFTVPQLREPGGRCPRSLQLPTRVSV